MHFPHFSVKSILNIPVKFDVTLLHSLKLEKTHDTAVLTAELLSVVSGIWC